MTVEDIEILLVEDNPSDQELTLHALGKGHLANRIQIAADGEEALDFIFCRGRYSARSSHHAPKLILLDLKLPKVDGLEVLREIKRDPRSKSIPVVVLTSSNEESDLIETYELGVNSYIQKPVDFDKFGETVCEVGFYWLVVNRLPPSNNSFPKE